MKHASHPKILARLKRAQGHLTAVIAMLQEQRPCAELTQQLHAVESAIINAKRELIHDHIEHCLGDEFGARRIDSKSALREFKNLARYL